MYVSAVAMVRAVQWYRSAQFALLAVLLFTLSGGTSAPAAGMFLHPSLFALATLHPAQRVNVIVQKSASDDHLEKTVAALGGQVTADLWIIHGFGAQVPAGALPELANAGGVRWISPDGAVQDASGGDAISAANLANTFVRTIGADKAWSGLLHPAYQGQGIGVAVMDSGIMQTGDFGSVMAVSSGSIDLSFNEWEKDQTDNYGHGTHVAGIIAGNGHNSNGLYVGIAPKANLFSLKIADRNGQGTTSGMLLASEWLLVNHTKYNIRVVNMSFSGNVSQSYHVDPIDVAVELLWMNGVVVVASVGNTGPNGAITAPANDPYVIAVGAADDKGTDNPGDDTLAVYSSYGTIENGIAKPDLIAPGRHIISVLASANMALAGSHSANILASNNKYFVMSGTSMAAPMVAGAVALLLQAQPSLTPNQVKGCLMANAATPPAGSKTKYVRADNVGTWSCATATSNQAVVPSNLTVTVARQIPGAGLSPGPATLGNVNWGNVNWGNVNWGNVNWGNVNWGNVNWGNVAWD